MVDPLQNEGTCLGGGYYSSRLLMSSKKLIEKFTDERLGRTLRTVITITICTLLFIVKPNRFLLTGPEL